MQKLVVNSVINPITAILKVKNGTLKRHQTLRDLIWSTVRESTHVVNTLGYNFSAKEVEHLVFDVIENTADNISSMLQDIMSGRTTEIEYINGEILRIAEENKVSAPINLTLYTLVKAFEHINRASQLKAKGYNVGVIP